MHIYATQSCMLKSLAGSEASEFECFCKHNNLSGNSQSFGQGKKIKLGSIDSLVRKYNSVGHVVFLIPVLIKQWHLAGIVVYMRTLYLDDMPRNRSKESVPPAFVA